MHRQWLLNQLKHYKSSCNKELTLQQKFIDMISRHSKCFESNYIPAHITASALLLNIELTHILLTLHRKIGMWLQLGGHCDGDGHTLNVAIREAKEESGISSIVPVSKQIFYLDIYNIPTTNKIDEHKHYDVSYVLLCKNNTQYTISYESLDLKWISLKEIDKFKLDPSLLNLISKWKKSNE